MQLKCCCAQIASKTLDPQANREKADRFIRQAADLGAQLVLLPEYLTTGNVYDRRLQNLAETLEGTSVSWLRGLSREVGCWIGVGMVERDNSRVYNTLVFAGPNGEFHWYRKRYPAFFENLYFHKGRSLGVVSTPFGRVGLMICWDMVQPRLAREMCGRIDLLLISSSWPRLTGGNIPLWGFQRWSDRQLDERPRRLARQLAVPVVYCNSTGPWDTPVPGTPFTYRTALAGHSAVIDASGRTVASADSEETLVSGELRVFSCASAEFAHAA